MSAQPPSDDLLALYESLSERTRVHFNRACATVRIIEMGYGVYGHEPEPAAVIPYIRRRVYEGVDEDAELHAHVEACRECRKLLRRHQIRRAVYRRLGVETVHWAS